MTAALKLLFATKALGGSRAQQCQMGSETVHRRKSDGETLAPTA